MTRHAFPSFGALLKSFRKRQHLTQQRLAETIGVHRSTLIRWEQGDVLPESKTTVLELARCLYLNEQETRHLLEASLTALAPHWFVPIPRNPYFTGREEVLAALHAQLGGRQAEAFVQSSALHGLGGIGKTQIALEYAYRHALEYSAVFWIRSETDECIVSSFLQIAGMLQLPERDDKDQQRVIAAVQRWLATHSQWLLIWDNLEDLDLLNHFLLSARQGASLITTRSQALGTLARSLDLLPMEQEEGILFLLRRAKILSAEATNEQVHQFSRQMPEQYQAAAELVTILGALPLALDQAGAYLEETRCGLLGYFQRYQQQQIRLLDQRGGSASGHPHSVATTFRLSLTRIERAQPAAMDMLRVCAFLHADAIPEEVFRESTGYLGPELECLTNDPTRFDLAIAILRNLSLVQRHPETQTLSIHRLVQTVLRESMEATLAQQWSVRAIRAINAVFLEPEFVNWTRCERCVPHAQVCLQFGEQIRRSGPEARELFCKAGSYLLERGRYLEAERFLAQAYTLGEQNGENDLLAAVTLDRLATLYWRQGKYQQAEPLFQRALTIREHHPDPTHDETASYLSNLALLYYEQGDYQRAEMLQQRSLALAGHAQSFDNMARIFQAQGKYEQAEQLYQRALALWEDQPGPPDPALTFSLNNLGNLYLEQGKYELAEPLLRRALAFRQQVLGPDHPRTATSLHNLARLFLKQKKYQEALQASRQALLILERRAGLDDLYLARVLENMGVLYQVQGKYQQAEPFFMRALTIQEQQQGPHHPNTAQTLHDLALLRQKQGNLREALSLAEHAFKILSQALGEVHPKTLASRMLTLQLLQEQAGDQQSALFQPDTVEASDQHEAERQIEETLISSQQVIDSVSSEHDPLQAFLDDCCELHSRAWCRSVDLWQAYERWVEDHQERYPLSRGAFIAQLKTHGCRAARINTARIWRGIAIVTVSDG